MFLKTNNSFILRTIFLITCLLLTCHSNSSAEIKCDFISIKCNNSNECKEYKPEKVFLFGGKVDQLIKQYETGLEVKGIETRHIARKFEIVFFNEKNEKNTLKMNAMKAAFTDKKEKLLDDIRIKAEGKYARNIKSDEDIEALSKNGDIFACMPVKQLASEKQELTKNVKPKRSKQGDSIVKTKDATILYSIQGDSHNPLASVSQKTKTKLKSWQVNTPEKTIQLGPELPENFHATLIVTPQKDGVIIAGFRKRDSDKPNYHIVINNQGSVLKKIGETETELKKNSYKPIDDKQIKLEIFRDHELARILVDGAQILHGDVESDHMLTMKRFFISGAFTLNNLTIQEVKN